MSYEEDRVLIAMLLRLQDAILVTAKLVVTKSTDYALPTDDFYMARAQRLMQDSYSDKYKHPTEDESSGVQ